MPADSRRDYEVRIGKAVRQKIFSDEYFQEYFTNRLTGEFKVYGHPLVFHSLPFYPAIAAWIEDVHYEGRMITATLRTQVAFQMADLTEAKEQCTMFLKDIKATLECRGNLAVVVDDIPVQVGLIVADTLDVQFIATENNLWTHISELEFAITTA